jgi:hypothetical protein
VNEGTAVSAGSARVVITLGDIPATGHLADAEALRGPALTSPDEIAPDFLDLVARNLPASTDGLLVVHPSWQADPARRLIRLARGMLDTDQVASVGLDLPPLACSVAADLLALAAPHLTIGHLAGLAVRLSGALLSGARLASVSKLEHIDTRLTQHMASYSPGSGFLAWAAPERRIDRISRRRRLTLPDSRPAEPVHLLLAPGGTDFPEFEKELGESLRPGTVKKAAAQPLGTTFWGTRKHVEFVAFSAHPEALFDIVRSTRYWMCRWCRQPTALDVCAICGMFQEAAETVSGRVREVVGVTAGPSGGAPGVSPEGGDLADRGPALPAPPAFLTPGLTASETPRADAPPAQETTPAAEETPAAAKPAAAKPAGTEEAPARSATPGTPPTDVRSRRGSEDDRAVPFGKGAAGVTSPAASGGRTPDEETTGQAQPAGTATPAQHDQQESQSP